MHNTRVADVGKMTTNEKEQVLTEFECSDGEWENDNDLRRVYIALMDSYVDDLYSN